MWHLAAISIKINGNCRIKTLPHEAKLPCSYLLEPVTTISNVSKAMGLTRLTYVLEQNRSEQFRWGWMLGNKDETPSDRDMMIKGRCKCRLGGREQRKILPNRRPLFTYALYECDKRRVLVAQSFIYLLVAPTCLVVMSTYKEWINPWSFYSSTENKGRSTFMSLRDNVQQQSDSILQAPKGRPVVTFTL